MEVGGVVVGRWFMDYGGGVNNTNTLPWMSACTCEKKSAKKMSRKFLQDSSSMFWNLFIAHNSSMLFFLSPLYE